MLEAVTSQERDLKNIHVLKVFSMQYQFPLLRMCSSWSSSSVCESYQTRANVCAVDVLCHRTGVFGELLSQATKLGAESIKDELQHENSENSFFFFSPKTSFHSQHREWLWPRDIDHFEAQ